MSIWITNTDGKRDAVLTLTLIGFLVIITKLLLAGCTITYGDGSYTFGPLGAPEIGAVLTPTLGAYVARRYTDKKSAIETSSVSVEEKKECSCAK